MAASVVFTLNPGGIAELTQSPTGDVGRFMVRVGLAVAETARKMAPRGETQQLANSITTRQIQRSEGPSAEVSANTPYARAVHEGARPHPIEGNPLLVFPSGRQARNAQGRFIKGLVFTPRVNHPGNAANPFLLDAARVVVTAL